jgi:hypothetical protein
MISVFISSTSKDLLEHRRAVIETLLKAGIHPIGMEHFASQSGDAETVSINELHKADLFVGVYAHRYGYRPDDDKSVTELEYIAAKNREKPLPRLIFVVEENYHHPLIDQHAETDSETTTLLAGFKRRLGKNEVWLTFTTPEDLAAKVSASVTRWLQKQGVKNDRPSGGGSVNIQGDMIGGNAIGNLEVNGGTVNFDSSGGKKKQ